MLPNAEKGFVVGLVDAIHEVVPSLGKCVAYGLDEEDAVHIFWPGLRGEARCHEISQGGIVYNWYVEFFRDGAWINEKNDYFSLPIFPGLFLFLNRKKEKVLWNDPGGLS